MTYDWRVPKIKEVLVEMGHVDISVKFRVWLTRAEVKEVYQLFFLWFQYILHHYAKSEISCNINIKFKEKKNF